MSGQQSTTPITTRPATPADLPFLWDMLFESAFLGEDVRNEWRRTGAPPDIRRYLDGWGRAGDAGIVAEDAGGERMGAAWYRLFDPGERGLGIVSWADAPELAIAVVEAYRGRGVGAALLEALARSARDDGYPRLVLSVDPRNEVAVRLYERQGYVRVDADPADAGTSWIMELKL